MSVHELLLLGCALCFMLVISPCRPEEEVLQKTALFAVNDSVPQAHGPSELRRRPLSLPPLDGIKRGTEPGWNDRRMPPRGFGSAAEASMALGFARTRLRCISSGLSATDASEAIGRLDHPIIMVYVSFAFGVQLRLSQVWRSSSEWVIIGRVAG